MQPYPRKGDEAKLTKSVATSLESIYQPLDDASTSIRLIRVLPALSDGRLHIHMAQTRMPVSYVCLSYIWGDDKEEREIFVNDHLVRVRNNLYQFLRVAEARYNEPLWVDALCINQFDHVEKSHQVQHMGQIYEAAEAVLIWLGAEPELDYLFKLVDTAITTSTSNNKPTKNDLQNKLEECFSSDGMGVGFQKDLYNVCLLRFVNHAYWTRIWMVQEFIVSRRLFLMNENLAIDWECFHFSMQFLNRRLTGEEAFSISSTISLYHRARMTYPDFKNGISSLLIWLVHSKCYDIRDRIYGLLSVAEDGSSFTVDYNEDAYSLFWRCGEHFRVWNRPTEVRRLQLALLPVGEPARHRRLAAAKPPEVTVDVNGRDLWNRGEGQVFRPPVKCIQCEWEYYPSQGGGFSTGVTGLVLVFCLGERGQIGHALIVQDLSPSPFKVRFFPRILRFVPGSVAAHDLDPGSLLQSPGGDWVETQKTKDFESLVRESEDGESVTSFCRVQYKLKVPADVILTCVPGMIEDETQCG